MDNKINLRIFSSIGPLTNHFIIRTPITVKFGELRRKITTRLNAGIHTQIILVKDSKEINPDVDSMQLLGLGLKDNDELTVSLDTPHIPSYSLKCERISDQLIPQEIIQDCLSHANSNTTIEVSGVLVGKQDDNGLSITAAIPVSEGNKVSVKLDPVVVSKIAEQLRKTGDYLIGWYHSHPKSVEPSSVDLRLQAAYQQMFPQCIAMVIDNVLQSVMLFRSSSYPPKLVLNKSTPNIITMDSDSIMLTTTLAKKQSAHIVSVIVDNIQTGNDAILKIKIQNDGNVQISNMVVACVITSSDNKDILHISSQPFNLDVNEIKSITLNQKIPLDWNDGPLTVRSGLKIVNSNEWMQRSYLSTFDVQQPPIYDVILKVGQSEQEILPNQIATYVIVVTNKGNRQDVIEIKYNLDESLKDLWTVKVFGDKKETTSPFHVKLNPGESKRIQVKVKSPETGKAGTNLPLSFQAKSLKGKIQN